MGMDVMPKVRLGEDCNVWPGKDLGIVLLGRSFDNHEITPKPAGHDSIVRHIAFFLCSGRTVSTRQLTASSLVEMRLLDLSFVR